MKSESKKVNPMKSKRIFMQILLGMLLLVIIVFSAQNYSLLIIKFLNWKIEIPAFVAFTLFYLIGAVSGGLVISLIRNATRANTAPEQQENS
jgi:uncharacterized integral membrane protein